MGRRPGRGGVGAGLPAALLVLTGFPREARPGGIRWAVSGGRGGSRPWQIGGRRICERLSANSKGNNCYYRAHMKDAFIGLSTVRALFSFNFRIKPMK